ncbi:hypothetical protein APHAL10511_005759 [Amanita phalloides]|nr:hypothetical protein APHAL10511_005759 [Amanita phalloides]
MLSLLHTHFCSPSHMPTLLTLCMPTLLALLCPLLLILSCAPPVSLILTISLPPCFPLHNVLYCTVCRADILLAASGVSIAPPPHATVIHFLPSHVSKQQSSCLHQHDEDSSSSEDSGSNFSNAADGCDDDGCDKEGEGGTNEQEEESEQGEVGVEKDLASAVHDTPVDVTKGMDKGVEDDESSKEKIEAWKDVTMSSPPPPPLYGNVYNFADADADADGLDLPLLQDHKGAVKLFTNLAEAEDTTTKPLVVKTTVVPNIAPVLRRLAKLSPHIENDDHHVIILEDNQWNMLGKYSLAIEENEEIMWSHENGISSLTLCISATDPLTARSGGGSGAGSALSAPAAPESIAIQSGDHSKKELITLLNIPEHLTTETKGKNLVYMEAGTWVGKRPTNITIIQLFTSKTSWFSYVIPAFSNINNFPELKKWLEGGDDSPTDIEVWGWEKSTYTFAELKEEKERRSKKTEKGKKKAVASSTAEARKHKRRNK